MNNEEKVKQIGIDTIVKLPIPLIGEPNINGYIIDKDSFIKAMDRQVADKNGGILLFVDSPINNTIPIENIIGKVISFDTESVTVKMTTDMYNTYLCDHELNYYRADLFTKAHKMKDAYNIFEIEKILGFQLIIIKEGKAIVRRIV